MSYSHRVSKSKPVTIVVRIEKSHCDFLVRRAEAAGVSLSEYVRKVFRSYMSRCACENKENDFDGRL